MSMEKKAIGMVIRCMTRILSVSLMVLLLTPCSYAEDQVAVPAQAEVTSEQNQPPSVEVPATSPTGDITLPEPKNPTFKAVYSAVEGVLNFRGGNLRTQPSYGVVTLKSGEIKKIWSFSTGGKGLWGGGAGWTGQPALVKWSMDAKKKMNLPTEYKADSGFVEVIQASLNGNVYFFDLKTGRETRKPVVTGNPIKGSVSVDSRGYPLLYVGQGIQESAPIGFRIYSLINQKEIFYQNGFDAVAPRLWPNFDSSALFEAESDCLFVGGENGLLYRLDLHTKYDAEKGTIAIKPTVSRFNPAPVGSPEATGKKEGKLSKYGIENSLAAYGDALFFADNGGRLWCVGTDMKLRWQLPYTDDTDASITLDLENGVPYLYTACEVDWQGKTGNCKIRKIDGRDGKTVWTRYFMCYSRFGESPSNGGALATNVVGRQDIEDLVVFTLSRCGSFDKGVMVALDKKTGKDRWRWQMPTYAWSSPLPLYKSSGKSYLLQADHSGEVWLLEGKTGRPLSHVKLDTYFEASPAAFNNQVVLTSRTGRVYGLTIK